MLAGVFGYLSGERDLHDEGDGAEDDEEDFSAPGSAHLSWEHVDH